MKRFTKRDEYGNADIIGLSDVMPDIYGGLMFEDANVLTAALNRLAAYEDTGLAPGEVELLKDDKTRLYKLADNTKNITKGESDE